jgi:phage terminase small subunit
MNEKQKHFADEYIISKNATKSAIKAGYSEKTAYSIGQRLLKKVEISEYIKKRTEEHFNERSMSIAEALAISASIARGEPQKRYSKKVIKSNGEEMEEVVSGEYTPSIEDRQRSIDHILKVSGAYLDRKEIDVQGSVVFMNEDSIAD